MDSHQKIKLVDEQGEEVEVDLKSEGTEIEGIGHVPSAVVMSTPIKVDGEHVGYAHTTITLYDNADGAIGVTPIVTAEFTT